MHVSVSSDTRQSSSQKIPVFNERVSCVNTLAGMLEGGLRSWPGRLEESVQDDLAIRQKRSEHD